MRDPRDKILDAFLDELHNDRRPGRSSEKILQEINGKHRSQPKAPKSGTKTTKRNSDSAGTGSPLSVAPGYVAAEHDESPDQGGAFDWSPIYSAIAVVAVSAAVVFVTIVKMSDNDNDSTAEVEQPAINRPRPENPAPIPPRPETPPPGENGIAKNEPALPAAPNTNGPTTDPSITNPALRDDVPNDRNALVFPGPFQRKTTTGLAAVSAIEMANTINQSLARIWEDRRIQRSPAPEMRLWADRLASRLIGRPLAVEEIRQFRELLNPKSTDELADAQARTALVRQMLSQPNLRQEFNKHWGHVLAWQWLGISQPMMTADSDLLETRRWVSQAIAQNRPLDQVAYQMISAVGSTASSEEDYNPASHYLVGLLKRFGSDQKLATSHVANVMTGHRFQCAQCHNGYGQDQLATQESYYQFHSFFAQMRVEPIGSGPRPEGYKILNRNYLPLGRQGKVRAALPYKDLDGNIHEVLPEFEGTRLDSNGFVAKVDRRTELANLITASPRFRETMVDQVWASMLNLPISGINGGISPELAELRSRIGDQLAANEFNLAWLVESIAVSDAFAAGVQPDQMASDQNPFLGAQPVFNVFYSRLGNRRSAIQSLQIVATAYTSGDTGQAASAGLLARISGVSEQPKPKFILPFVPSKDSMWATSPAISSQLDAITESEMSDADKLKHIFLAALGRQATPAEFQQATAILESSDDPPMALKDIWWSLLNSIEYKLPLAIR